ncbi:MAG: hypothetical protein ACRBB6_04155 [Neptuniibacter sp.]
MEKVIFFLKAVGIVFLAGVLVAGVYFFSIIGSVALVLFLVFIGLNEYYKKPPTDPGD